MLRTSVAIAAGKIARIASRLKGGGSALPGLVVERIDPQFLAATLGALPEGIVVVSGTNGKTTTTKMLVALLREHGLEVFTNPTGSNFTRGVISSMIPQVQLNGKLAADIAVLELDEAHSLKFAEVVKPRHALLLNVARDQLDRFAEIDYTAKLLTTLAQQTTTSVTLNQDDSFISRIADEISDDIEVIWFGLHPDIADRLPELRETDARFDEDHQIAKQTDSGLLRPRDSQSFDICWKNATVGPVTLRQRGLAAMINATAATAAARALLGDRFAPDAAMRALAAVAPPFGRGEVIDADGRQLELVLVKNPAGFTVALGTYGSEAVPSMIAINDKYADGQDVSWLYDVSFESLRKQGVAITSGVRAYDMAVRLRYDDVAVAQVEPDLERALDAFLTQHSSGPIRIFCTYTAMMSLRQILVNRYDVPEFGQEAH
ncbi:MAG: DUF1727 domain-containing protein [Propionibacteriaceae bacterium]